MDSEYSAPRNRGSRDMFEFSSTKAMAFILKSVKQAVRPDILKSVTISGCSSFIVSCFSFTYRVISSL